MAKSCSPKQNQEQKDLNKSSGTARIQHHRTTCAAASDLSQQDKEAIHKSKMQANCLNFPHVQLEPKLGSTREINWNTWAHWLETELKIEEPWEFILSKLDEIKTRTGLADPEVRVLFDRCLRIFRKLYPHGPSLEQLVDEAVKRRRKVSSGTDVETG